MPAKNKIPNPKKIVAIMDATFGNFLLNKKRGKTMTVAVNARKKGYRKPDQNDSFQIRTLPIPRKTQSNNKMPQAITVPCFALDRLKS